MNTKKKEEGPQPQDEGGKEERARLQELIKMERDAKLMEISQPSKIMEWKLKLEAVLDEAEQLGLFKEAWMIVDGRRELKEQRYLQWKKKQQQENEI